MASTSGSVISSKYNSKKWLVLNWKRTGYSSANSTSTIYWELKGDGTSSTAYHESDSFKVKIGNTSSNAKVLYEYTSSSRLKLYPRNTYC